MANRRAKRAEMYDSGEPVELKPGTFDLVVFKAN